MTWREDSERVGVGERERERETVTLAVCLVANSMED